MEAQRRFKSLARPVWQYVRRRLVLSANLAFRGVRRGVIHDLAGWVAKQQRLLLPFDCHPRAWLKQVRPQEETFLAPGETKGEFRLFGELKWFLNKETKVLYAKDLAVCGPGGVILAPDGRRFADLSYSAEGRRFDVPVYFGDRVLDPRSRINGWSTSLVTPTAGNYFHWLLESLPRLGALHPYADLLDNVIIPAQPKPFHIQSLMHLGYRSDRLIELFPTSNLQLEHSFLSTYSARDNVPRWVPDWYRSHFLDLAATRRHGARIFVSRTDAGTRRISNFEEIRPLLEDYEFEVIEPGRLSFADQVNAFSRADFIIGEHGAGLTNLLFARPGTRVLEIFSAYWMAPCFFSIARAADLKYTYFVCEGPDIREQVAANVSAASIDGTLDRDLSHSYELDPRRFRAAIERFIQGEGRWL